LLDLLQVWWYRCKLWVLTPKMPPSHGGLELLSNTSMKLNKSYALIAQQVQY